MRTRVLWVANTDDDPIPPRVKLRIFEKFDGRCACCGRKIRAGERWELDHIVALINGGAHEEANLQPLLTEHHKNKTKADIAQKSKSYEKRRKHVGVRRPRTIRQWRRFSGEIVTAPRER